MNRELGIQILEDIVNAPKLFNMAFWARENPCGTAACLAGKTMLRKSYTTRLNPTSAWGELKFFRPNGSQVYTEAEEAQMLLDLTDEEVYETTSEYGDGLFWLTDEQALKRFVELVDPPQDLRYLVEKLIRDMEANLI